MMKLKSPNEISAHIPEITLEELERVLCNEDYPSLRHIEELWKELDVEVWILIGKQSKKTASSNMGVAEFTEDIGENYTISLYILDDYGHGLYVIRHKEQKGGVP